MKNKFKITINSTLNLFLIIVTLINLLIIDVNINLLFILIIFQLCIFLKPKTDILTKIICMFYFEVMVIMISLNVITFDFMPQAKVMLNPNNSIITYFISGHPHAIRFLIAYPGYIISNFAKIDLNQGYSYYIIMIFCMLYINILESYRYTIKKLSFYSYILEQYMIFSIIILLSILMNGRVVFAFLGFSMIIKTFLKTNVFKLNNRDYIYILIGVILSTVSSGTMLVVIIFMVLAIISIYNEKLIRNFKKNNVNTIILYFFSIPVIIIFLKYLNIMLRRNIDYYGGGFWGLINMMSHGAGRYFNNSVFGIIVFLITVLFNIIVGYKFIKIKLRKNEQVYIVLFLAVISCLIGFIFGYSAGSLVLIPLIIINLRFFLKEKI